MAYRDEVLVDAPVLYFGLDGATGAQTNLGTAGGTATAPGTAPTTGQTAPTNVAGAAWLFGSGTTAYLSRTGLTTGTAWTIEFWYKRSVTTSAVRRILRVNQTTTVYFEVTINPGTGLLNVVDNSGMNNGITSAALIDNAWHHVAIVRSGNSNHEFFIDGVSQGTLIGTGTAKTSATVYIGGYTTSNSGASSYLDEVAFYNTALTNTRVLAHYNSTVGVAPVSVSNSPPAMTASVEAPDVTAGAGTGVNNASPAMTATAAAPNVASVAAKNVTSSVPAATAAGSAPDVTVTAIDAVNQTLSPTEDFFIGSGSGGTTSFADITSGGNGIALKFSPTIPAGKRIASATLTLTRSGSGTSVNYQVRPLSASWTEAQGTSPGSFGAVASTGNIAAGSTATTFTVDVTLAMRADVGNGIAITGTSGGTTSIHTRESAFTDRRPSLALVYEDNPAVPITVTVDPLTASATLPVPVMIGTMNFNTPLPVATATAAAVAPVISLGTKALVPAATATVAMPAPTSTGVKNVSITVTSITILATMVPAAIVTDSKQNVDAATATIELSAPIVEADRSVTIAVPDMNATIVMFQGVHADTPDVIAQAPVMTGHARMPQVEQFIRTDVIAGAVPMTASTEEVEVIFTNQTNQNVRVLNAMTANARLMANYDPDADRYLVLVPQTVDSDDKWFKMDETNGSVAVDYATGIDPETQQVTGKADGTYVGSPTLAIDGPQSRPAVHFTGSNVLKPGAFGLGVFAQSEMTYEFSIKTTQANGVIIAGGGSYQTATTGPAGGAYNNASIRLVNGKITLRTPGSPDFTIQKVINDGIWHHVVVSLPTSQGFNEWNLSANRPSFVMVDGVQAWTRYQFGSVAPIDFLPWSVMGVSGAGSLVSEGIVGDMRDFVVRLNYAVSPNTALSLYYEWSNAILIQASPMTAEADLVDGVHGAGNIKKMLLLYGLPYALHGTRDGVLNYYSIFAGFNIPNNGVVSANDEETEAAGQPTGLYSNGVQMNYLIPRTFHLEGYLVYPTAIMKQSGSNGGPFSVPGIENGENIDPWLGVYIDDATGLPRFVDLDKDLRADATDFDVISVINYPAQYPVDAVDVTAPDNTSLFEPRQHSMGLTKTEWATARDRLRDSILNATYSGVSLWITEPHAAEHLGFITAWDKHSLAPGVQLNGYTNNRAAELDRAHNGTSANPTNRDSFHPNWQAIAKRRIVNLEEGLTDLPSWDRTDTIQFQAADLWRPHAQFIAYDLIDRMAGLQVNDETWLSIKTEQNNSIPSSFSQEGQWSVGNPRQFIVSAKPEGIVGKVISKEPAVFYGPNGVSYRNPYADNAMTIVVETGTPVRGQSIGGRVFIEFMDPMTKRYKLIQDINKNLLNGAPTNTPTTWSFDSRRYSQLVAVFVINRELTRNVNGGTSVTAFTREDRYIDIEDPTPNQATVPYMSMNARGLNWIAAMEDVAPGERKIFVSAANINASMSDVTLSADRNTVVEVEASEAFAEVRVPANYRPDDFVERVLPARARAELMGLGRVIEIGASTASVEMPDVTSVTTGDTVAVYMDFEREITLYLKED